MVGRVLLISIALMGPLASAAHPAGPADLLRAASKTGSIRVDHSAWTHLLKTYIERGADGINRVNYAAFKRQGHLKLKHYIRSVEAADLHRLDRSEQFALLANLYNAKTVDIVLDRYPVTSIKEINLGGGFLGIVGGGPWKAKVARLSGVDLSLDDLEHAMLRPVFRDPRVHYALNCASIGCPNLHTAAFTGADLQAQLDAAARAFVNHPRGVGIGENRLIASSIYQWFKADFSGSDDGVLRHLRQYSNPQQAERLKPYAKIDGFQYDWTLNDVRR
jgi:hypothetical protein